MESETGVKIVIYDEETGDYYDENNNKIEYKDEEEEAPPELDPGRLKRSTPFTKSLERRMTVELDRNFYYNNRPKGKSPSTIDASSVGKRSYARNVEVTWKVKCIRALFLATIICVATFLVAFPVVTSIIEDNKNFNQTEAEAEQSILVRQDERLCNQE